MDVSFDNRLELSIPDGGFDPVAEIRRLRQDLMLRLQRLQQSIASEEKQLSEVFSKSETVLYVSPDAPSAATASVLVNTLPIQPEKETVVQTPVVEEVVESRIAVPSEPTTVVEESVLVRILHRVNAVLVAVGAVATIAGLTYFGFQRLLANPQELATIFLAAGATMVFVGVVGGLAYWFSGNTAPSSL